MPGIKGPVPPPLWIRATIFNCLLWRCYPTAAPAVKATAGPALLAAHLRHLQVAARRRVVAFIQRCDNAVAMPVHRDPKVHIPDPDRD